MDELIQWKALFEVKAEEQEEGAGARSDASPGRQSHTTADGKKVETDSAKIAHWFETQ